MSYDRLLKIHPQKTPTNFTWRVLDDEELNIWERAYVTHIDKECVYYRAFCCSPEYKKEHKDCKSTNASAIFNCVEE